MKELFFQNLVTRIASVASTFWVLVDVNCHCNYIVSLVEVHQYLVELISSLEKLYTIVYGGLRGYFRVFKVLMSRFALLFEGIQLY